MRYIFVAIAILSLVACTPAPATPSVDMTQTAVAQTLVAQPTQVNSPIPESTNTKPVSTPNLTNTPRPTDTEIPTSTQSIEEIRQKFLEMTIEFLERGEGMEDIESVSLVRFGEPGLLEIEVKSEYASRDRQPELSYTIISFLATALGGGLERESLLKLGGGDDFTIHITTYSTNGDYRYQSDTNYETLMKVKNKQISYVEWVAAANAEFR